MSIFPLTKTGADIAAYVKRQFGDESGVQITDNDIFRWLSSAQNQIVSKIAPIQARSTTDVINGVNAYDLSGLNIHQIESIHFNGNFLPYKNFQEAERDIYLTQENSDTAAHPAFWYSFASEVFLFPKPNRSITGGLTIYYSKAATPVVTGSDPLSVPDKFFDAVVSWVLSKAYELDEDYDQAHTYRQLFENQILEQNGEEKTMSNSTYPVITYIGD